MGKLRVQTGATSLRGKITRLSPKGNIAHRIRCHADFDYSCLLLSVGQSVARSPNADPNCFAKRTICRGSGWPVPSSQARTEAVAIPIFCATCQSVSLFSYRLTWIKSPSVFMLVGKGLRGCRLAGTWLRNPNLSLCNTQQEYSPPRGRGEREFRFRPIRKTGHCRLALQ